MQQGGSPAAAPALLVALHFGHHDKVRAIQSEGSPDASYVNHELSPAELIDHISLGFAWVAAHLGPHAGTGEVGWRHEDAYLCSNVCALDIDGDLQLADFWAIPFAQRHCLFTATSCSHLKEGRDRYRAVFWFEPTISDIDLHRHIVMALEERLGLEIKDASGRKPERLWYGNSRTEVAHGKGEGLPAELIFDAQDALAEERRRLAEPRPAPSADQALQIRQATWLLDSGALPPTSDGQYNDVWIRVLAAAGCANDESLWAAFLGWHQRGHHAKKNSQRKCERERNKVRKSGVEAIFAVAANLIGKDWRRLLPAELKDPRRVQEPPRSLIRQVAPSDGPVEPQPPAPPPPQAAAPTPLVSAAIPDSVHPAELQQHREALVRSRAPVETPGSVAAAQPAEASADAMMELITRIYRLTVYHEHVTAEGTEVVASDDVDALIEFYTNQLYAYPLFAREPQRLAANLLARFEREHGLAQRCKSNLRPRRLGENVPAEPTWVIPELIARGSTYLLFGKEGTGKTTFALCLARAAIAAPGYRGFLGYPEVPAENYRRGRVLIIATDGGDEARSNLATYARWHQMLGEEWEQHYLRLMGAASSERAPAWKIDLFNLHHLGEVLDEAAAEGLPYTLIIFDSLKAICPPNTKVGEQIITRYIEVIRDICQPRGVAQLYLHHQSRDGDYAQGVTGLVEMTQGNFQITDSGDEGGGHHVFRIRKTRASWDGHKDIPFTIARGKISSLMEVQQHLPVSPEDFALRIFHAHMNRFRIEQVEIPSTSDARIYPGLRLDDFYVFMTQQGERHPDLDSRDKTEKFLRRMKKDGLLISTGTGRHGSGLIPSNVDPRTLNSSQQVLDVGDAWLDEPEDEDD